MNCTRHTIVNERTEDYADFCAGCERGDDCYCEEGQLCQYHADIDRMMENAGYYDDAEPFTTEEPQ